MSRSGKGFYELVNELSLSSSTKKYIKRVVINDLSQINIFIGPNNEGKSQILRELLNEDFFYIPLSNIGDLATNLRIVLEKSYSELLSFPTYPPKPELEKLLKLTHQELKARYFTEQFNDTSELPSKYITAISEVFEIFRAQNKLPLEFLRDFNEEYTKGFHTPRQKFFYIPVLRSVRRFREIDSTIIDSDLYSDITSVEYKIDPEKIHTGYGIYADLVTYLLGNHAERAEIERYKKFLGNRFFNGLPITLIPYEKTKTITIKIGDEDDREIHQLGDGLQTILILTLFPWITEEPAVFCVEEPETSLHPGLQRALIRALSAPEFARHTFFMTSHSNHFLDLQLEQDNISIYKTQRNAEGAITLEKFLDKDATILTDLGVRPSSVLLTNLAILVEGITDRLYLQIYFRKYLEKYAKDKEILEGKDYSFIEYQGSNIVHWDFSSADHEEKMNSSNFFRHIFLVADGDSPGKGNRSELFNTFDEEMKYITKGKEIENLIPESTLKTLYAEEHWKDLIKEGDYSQNPQLGMGYYLDTLSGISGELSDGNTGTIKNKLNFCQSICTILKKQSFEAIITGERKVVCEKIYNAIKELRDS